MLTSTDNAPATGHTPSPVNSTLLRAVTAVLEDPLVVLDLEGTILEANEAFARVVGKPLQQCLNTSAYYLLPPELASERRKDVQDALAAGKSICFENEHKGRLFQSTLYPLAESDGKITRLFIVAKEITETRIAERIAANEQDFSKLLIENFPGSFSLTDSSGRYVRWSSYFRDEIVGKPESEMAGFSSLEVFHPDDRPVIAKSITNILQHNVEVVAVARVLIKGGPEFQWRLITGRKIILKGNPHIIAFGIDITKRKEEKDKLHRLSRALQATSDCNQALIHTHDENKLLQKICSIIVETGGYKMAWVGYAQQNKAKSIRPVASAGLSEDYLKQLTVTWDDTPHGQGPTGTAIRTGQICTINNILQDPLFEPWRSAAQIQGYFSVQSLPLKIDNMTFGALTLYSGTPNAFNEEDTALLSSLADNLAYGVNIIRRRNEQQKAEKALRESEGRFRKLFEGNSAIQLIIDPATGCIIAANPLAAAFYGWSAEELCQMRIQDINTLSPEEITVVMEQSCIGKNHFFFRHRRADHSIRDVEVYSCTMEMEGKNIVHAIIHDNTERKSYEDVAAFRFNLLQLAESSSLEELLKFTLEEAERLTESSIGFFYLVSDNQESLSLQAWSTNTITNRCRAEGTREHYPLAEAGVWADAVRERKPLIHNDLKTLKYQKGLPEGHSEIVRELVIPIIRSKKVVAILGVGNKNLNYDEDDIRLVQILADLAWDIASKKRAEQSELDMQKIMLHSQKMEMIGQLAGGIAHDFNNLLTVILGHAEMALEKGSASRESLDIIYKTARQSADLTRQLLTFARKQTLILKDVELNSAVERILPMLTQLIGEHISLIWLPESSNTCVTADPSQIDQILVNLVVNARDAIDEEGTITIKTEVVHVDNASLDAAHPCKECGEYAVLIVTDSGNGIAKADQPFIFEPFFTTKPVGKGTGMGLSTIYGIVKQNKGYIDFQSKEGKGTSFTLYLPLQNNPVAESKREWKPVTAKGRETILLVEDQPNILKLYQQMLEDNGYTVHAALTPKEAILIAEKYKGNIDLLLTDVIMPEMNGNNLAKTVKSICPDIKTLFMSGYTADIIEGKGVFDKGTSFIEKPFTFKVLMATLQKALQTDIPLG